MSGSAIDRRGFLGAVGLGSVGAMLAGGFPARALSAAKRAGLITSVIEDAGHTEVAPGTVTCMGMGPDTEERIDKLTKNLQPL